MPFPNIETQFKPGESGNPSGRPKGTVDVMRMAQRLLEDADALPAALAETIRSRCGGDRRAVEAVLLSLLLEALQGDTKAAKELLDRAYGKVSDNVDVTHKGDADAPAVFTIKIDNS